ncbi:L-type lectin-domain-containing protein [Cinnamomum micranthum f. kanehirae]|uniref:non-specific serine/threonine protein kinase n=1 Tax=Cinnamomum micranthum f. kanehirae TaxID=337451 RepID=A0A443PEH3_9MAGN|nr:L-type lectin-domain-containing protein [Cinnamomum micranthum f. kanehirae]
MYVGFTAATGQLVQTHRILAWSFSNSNFSAYQGLITSNLPSFVPPKDSIFKSKGFIAGISVASIAFLGALLIFFIWARRRSIKRRRDEERDAIEEWELEYWPHRIRYNDILAATKAFSEENVIGIGGNGKVYKGVLGPGSIEIAVKCIPHESQHGMKEFLAEISSLGRLKHRNLVGLIGWCKQDKGGLMLAYEYMENGSLDKRVFFSDCDESSMLSWDARLSVLKDVAAGVLYLHEGWEVSVLHRDIKASNVMLDKSMNGRLGDFGLARMHEHGQALGTTRVVGTVGYMAPEVVRSGKASAKTDVFGFGVLVLEVVCGRRPVEDGYPPLVEWVWGLMEKKEMVMALDGRLRLKGGWEEEEVERVLHLGLVCVHPDPSSRPSMRQVVKFLEGARDGEESDGDGMEMSLLQKVESASSWFAKYQKWAVGRAHHPTFQDVKQSLSSSISLSGSDIIVEGR